jgi:hypothetical protein
MHRANNDDRIGWLDLVRLDCCMKGSAQANSRPRLRSDGCVLGLLSGGVVFINQCRGFESESDCSLAHVILSFCMCAEAINPGAVACRNPPEARAGNRKAESDSSSDFSGLRFQSQPVGTSAHIPQPFHQPQHIIFLLHLLVASSSTCMLHHHRGGVFISMAPRQQKKKQPVSHDDTVWKIIMQRGLARGCLTN